MARTPGFYPVPHAVDAIGRHGFGIGWEFMGGRVVVIFSPSTFAYLGSRTWPAPGRGGGNQYDGGALVAIAIVDHVGQT